MRFVVCVKYVPVLSQLRFDPETRRLVRDGVRGEPSSFDVRALLGALRLRATHGGEVVALTMGPPAAREALTYCLALGADRGVHLCDPALAGSDTLATARALAALLRRESPDLVLLGRASVDAETGQVGPEVAELLDLPQATAVRGLTLDLDRAAPSTPSARPTTASSTCAGRCRRWSPRRRTSPRSASRRKAERQAAAEKPIATLALADVGLRGRRRRRRRLADLGGRHRGGADDPARRAARRAPIRPPSRRALRARLLALGALGAHAGDHPPLPPPAGGDGPPIWVVAEMGPTGPRAVTAELLAKAAQLAAPLGARVEAVVIGPGAEHAPRSRAAGADRVLVADAAGLDAVHDRRARRRARRRHPAARAAARAPRARRCAAATSRRASPRASASGSPATRSTSTSTPRAASGS